MIDPHAAAERREFLYETVFNDTWDYAELLFELAFISLENVEGIFGADIAAAPLRALLEPIAEDFTSPKAVTWREAMEEPQAFYETLPLSRMFRDALLFGFGGIAPETIELPERAAWLEGLVKRTDAFAGRSDVTALRGGDNVLLRIAALARSRLAIDTGHGEVDAHSMSILGGITEGRVRNLMSDGTLERGPNGGIVAMGAAAWLQKKRGYMASIWQEEEAPEEDVPSSPDLLADRMMFVPVARDGSMFTPDLLRNGSYRIGAKGEEEDVTNYVEALARLNVMPVPRWRRPNEKGLWGIVSGVAWQRIEKKGEQI